MKTIAIAMDKGGVGKTTLTYNLASGLVRRGLRVLVIDADPQGTLSRSLCPQFIEGRGVADYIVPEKDAAAPEPVQVRERFHLLPATAKLRDVEFSKDGELYWRLKEGLVRLESHYDFCLIDNRPSLGPLTLCVLVAADEILIPVECDVLSIQELPPLLKTIQIVQKRYGRPDLKILGLVMNRVDVRTTLARQVRDTLKRGFEGQVFSAWIPQNVRIRESLGHRKDIFEYDVDAKGKRGVGAAVFDTFLDEFLTRCGHGAVQGTAA